MENSLISVQTYEKEVSVLAEQVQALQEIMDLSNKRYEEGVTSYLEVLENERSLFDVELSYYSTLSKKFSSYVNLYKAMGGDWYAQYEEIKKQEN